jgi:pimeloyl-ACP methyl ester carboxylesterase
MRRSRLRVRAGGDHKRGHRREKPLSLPHAVSTGAATKRVLDQLDGPFILVGHSYGASIMTVAGSDPKVKALVYVAPARPMPRIPGTAENSAAIPATTEDRSTLQSCPSPRDGLNGCCGSN